MMVKKNIPLKSKSGLCRICHRYLKRRLDEHVAGHIRARSQKCPHCDIILENRTKLKIHFRTHTNTRPYLCPVCGMRFTLASILRIHLRTHTGEKPYECAICAKRQMSVRFVQLAHLRKHVVMQHKSDKPYHCIQCDLSFTRKKLYNQHMSQCSQHDETSSRELSEVRVLLVILFKKILSERRCEKIGLGRLLVDDVLRTVLHDKTTEPITDANALLQKIHQFLEWSLPSDSLKKLLGAGYTAQDILVQVTQPLGSWNNKVTESVND